MAENPNWHKEETYRSMMDYGRGILRFVFLANGGAIIAVLSFLGNIVSKGVVLPSMQPPLIAFLLGLLCGGVGSITAYMTQLTLFNESINGLGGRGLSSHATWLYITLVAVILGIFSFGCGAFMAVTRLQ